AQDLLITGAGEEIVDALRVWEEAARRQTSPEMRVLVIELEAITVAAIAQLAPFGERHFVRRDPAADEDLVADARELVAEIERVDAVVQNAVSEYGVVTTGCPAARHLEIIGENFEVIPAHRVFRGEELDDVLGP